VKDLSLATIQTGVITPDMLGEFQRWKSPIEVPDGPVEPPKTAEAAVLALQQAAEATDQGPVVLTDPDVIARYKKTARPAQLHLQYELQELTIMAEIGRNALGEYLLPYNDSSIIDVLTSGESYVRFCVPPHPEGHTQRIFEDPIYPVSAVPLYLGDAMVFVAFKPAEKPT